MGKLQFVFVHGLSGWGSYDERYRRMPYWGMRGGDLMAALRGEGYDCYAASVLRGVTVLMIPVKRSLPMRRITAPPTADGSATNGTDRILPPAHDPRTGLYPLSGQGRTFIPESSDKVRGSLVFFRMQNRFPDRGRVVKNRSHFPRLFSGGTCQSGDKMV